VDATLLAAAMLVSLLLALEYDLVSFWDDFNDGQRRLRLDEILVLTAMLGVGVYSFILRRICEHRQDLERQQKADAETREILALASQDPLTSLPNRRVLRTALEAAIARAPAEGNLHAFYLLDLNGFKRINDENGHAVGDDVLCAVAKRFRAAARTEDMVARLGGDEFAVLASNVESRTAAYENGARFVAALSNKVRSGDRSYPIGVAIGVALYPDDGASVEEITHHADLAMYKAKEAKASMLRFFEAPREEPPAVSAA
jgi:diguanylate cyclase (GGDEF)-like protein